LVFAILIAVAGFGVAGCFVLSGMLPGGTPSPGDPTASIDVLAVPTVGTRYLTGWTRSSTWSRSGRNGSCKEQHTLETIASGKADAAAN
jgi:hypothetical protein